MCPAELRLRSDWLDTLNFWTYRRDSSTIMHYGRLRRIKHADGAVGHARSPLAVACPSSEWQLR